MENGKENLQNCEDSLNDRPELVRLATVYSYRSAVNSDIYINFKGYMIDTKPILQGRMGRFGNSLSLSVLGVVFNTNECQF